MLRTEALSPVLKPKPAKAAKKVGDPRPVQRRRVYFYRTGFVETPVYRSEDLGPGHSLTGPSIVERPDTTIVVGAGQRLEVEPYGNLIIHLEDKKAA